MKKVTSNKLILFCLLFLAVNFGIKAQERHALPVNYVFSPDSLKGFDENAAKQGAFDVEAYGEEFKVYMYNAKRNYIDSKYRIVRGPAIYPVSPIVPHNSITNKGITPGNPVIAVASCTNEDFEEQGLLSVVPNTVVVSTTGAINGWTSEGASNSTSSTSSNCTGSYAYTNPNMIRLIAPGPGGLTDAIIGSGYKIYSVFGTSTTNIAAAAGYDAFNHFGDWFVKLNDQSPLSSVNRVSKTFNVTAANALFQFAFISVLEGTHGCCDAGSFSLKVKLGCAVPVTTTCPQFTASANPGCLPVGNTTTYLTSTVNASWKYNKWKLNTLDLTSYIGQCVTIEVTAYDCTYTGHAGYVYFDAQCSPMDIIGNGTAYPAGTSSITLPTCGAGSSATITAPPITGGYTWTCPGPYTIVPPTGTISAGQQIITGITGDHTLTMNPPGSCSPIVRIIKVIIAPAPNLAITSNTMYSCSNTTVNGVSLLMSSGTATNNPSIPNYTVTISPTSPTGTAAVTANTGIYTGLSAGINTITIMDSVGCLATQTINVTPPPAVPILSIGTPSGNVIGCNPNYLPLVAVNTSTNPLLAGATFTYNWAGPSTASVNTGTFNVYSPGSYTLSGSATYTTASGNVTSCITTAVISITGSTLVPVCNVTPPTRTLTCNGSCAQFTASSTGTANLVGTWYSSSGPVVGPTGTPMLLCANAPGSYTAEFCSTISGCCTTQTVSVTSNTQVPTVTVTPTTFNGFTINCTNPKVGMDVNTNSITGPFGYTWTPLPSGSPSSPLTGGYTVTIPGQYEIKFVDGYSCTVTNTINVYIDTLRPSPFAITDLPSNSFTINCYNPNLISTAMTAPLLSASSYSWTQPVPLVTYPSNTINIGMINVTNSVTGVTYTVTALGPNGCIGKAKVKFFKDIAMPTYNPAYTPSLGITCGNPCVAMTPTTSGAPTPINFTFTSPPPTQTATTAGALMCVPGPYTMVYQNLANGCLKTGTVNVPQNVIPPAVNPQPVIYLPCGQTTTIVSAGTTTSSSTYSYTWEGPPGSGMSCLGGTACASPSVNAAGVYNVVIYNTVNGCTSSNSVLVVSGGIQAGINANPSSGYSPLSVNFDNTTQTGSTIAGTITTVWNFGNGITYTTSGTATSYSTSGLPGASTIYQSAGTYTVLLIVTQNNGTVTCTGTASTVVTVDLPSKLAVPNVFTPNGDGVNDVFMLQTTNITDVTCQIFDRWGVKMYDVTSDKGNISWDGKNFGKKDVPAGTYFYILTAKGKDGLTTWNDADGKEIPQKGTISLYR